MFSQSIRSVIERTRLLALGFVLFCAGHQAVGAPIDASHAHDAVTGWLRESGARFTAGDRVAAHHSGDGSTAFFIVPLKPQGYAIVAPDDEIEPIVAFSTEGSYRDVRQNPATDVLERDLTNRLHRLKDPIAARRDAGKRLAHRQRWKRMIAALAPALQMAPAPVTGTSGTISTINNTIINDLVVSPLTQSAWNQNNEYTASGSTVAVYDYYVPPGPNGSVNNDPCGCVATAWAQTMYFWKYPTAAVGTGTFQCWNNGAAVTLPLMGGNGSGGPYNWSSMPAVPANTAITLAQQEAIGALCYDAGVAMNMSYAPGGSGAWLSSATIRSTFQYANASEYWSSNSTWDEPTSRAIRTNLDAGHPAVIAIFGSGEGHEVIADGYGYSLGVMYDHCNFGWGGAQSLWYEFPYTDGPAVPNGPVAYFNTIDQVVFNVDPTTTGEMITGRVVNSSGSPISGAIATLKYGSALVATATTGSSGIYAFEGVASNTSYTVTAQVSGSSIQFGANPIAVTTGSSGDGAGVGNQIADFYQSTGNGAVADGMWITPAGGSWVDSLHWYNGGVPGGSGATADFSWVSLATDGIVTLDGTQTVGAMLFNSTDVTNGFGWIIAPGNGGAITLNASSGTPLISVASGAEVVQMDAVLSGTQGLEMTGTGELQLLETNNFTGPVTILSGMLYTRVQETGNTNTAYGPNSGGRTITVDSGGTLYWDINNVIAQSGAAASNLPTITLDGGVLTSSRYNAIGNLVLAGGTLNANSSDSGSYQAFQLLGSVTVNGSAGSVMNTDNSDGDHLLGGGSNTFNVAQTNSGGTDLLVTASLADGSGDYWGTGSLVKTGAGTMVLAGSNTYTGSTTVNAGTLCVTGSCTNSTIKINSGGTLSGTGQVAAVTVASGGTLTPGVSGGGALDLSGTLTLGGATVMDINASNGGCTSVKSTSKIAYGGSLTVSNLSGTPGYGNAFTLFSAAAYSGAFSSINLPALSSGLTWNTSNLSTNGSISIAASSGTLASLSVSPASPSVASGSTQQFTVTAYNQSHTVMSVPVDVTWSVIGAGAISSGGLYTAPYASGSATVIATCGSVSGSAAITVADAPPAVATSASATLLTPATVALSVLGADSDGGGASNLTYTWSATSLPAGAAAPGFSSNGSNAAQQTIATLSKSGTYTFTATISDLGGASVTSTTGIVVAQSLASITVTPASPVLSVSGSVTLSAACADQFGNAMGANPTLAWAASTGTVTPSGATGATYTAPAGFGGIANVTASSGGESGTDAITIASGTYGIWTNPGGGMWTTGTNWQGGGIPNSAGYIADFSMLSLSTTGTVSSNGNKTIGKLIFGDSASYGWVVNSSTNSIKLSGTGSVVPAIVVKNQSATINAVVTGSQGFTMSGAGTLQFTAQNSVSGPVTVSSGTLLSNAPNSYSGALGTAGSIAVNNGAMLEFGNDNALVGYAGTAPITLNPGGTLMETNGATAHLAGVLTMAGGSLAGGSASDLNNGDAWWYGSWNLDAGVIAGGVATTSTISAVGIALTGSGGTVFTVNRGSATGVDLDVPGAFWHLSGVSDNGLIKNGNGLMQLDGANTYSSPTTVNSGTLSIIGSISSSAATVNSGATLIGTGTAGEVTVNSGGVLTPGIGGAGGLNLSSNSLNLSGSTVMEINATTGASTSIQGITYANYGGALVVNNLGGTPVAGESFALFNAISYSGSFSSITLPSLPGTLQWNTEMLTANGSIEATLSPWGSWLSQSFTAPQMGNSAISSEAATPNGDGIANILKFATGLTPYSNAPLPVTESIATVSGSNYLELTVTKNPAATDVTYTVQVNGSLTSGTWSSAGTTIVENTSTTLVARDNTPMSSAQQRFIRLMVTGP